ncbi:MAG: hypothetical protein JJE25_00040 [Bacteroidia bacterium]|nr:hypothetical protein [Bacteroidia bacterium]
MTKEQKDTNLLQKEEGLCKILNENGIKDVSYYDGKYSEGNWGAWKDSPGSTFGGNICSQKPAFHYLKQNGYIDIGMCWKCGEEPITNQYSFNVREDKSIQYYICQECYEFGRSLKPWKIDESSKCYIATVCYGGEFAPEVLILKFFRDTTLTKYIFGRLFIKIYYLLSPTVANLLRDQARLNNFIKKYILNKIVSKVK